MMARVPALPVGALLLATSGVLLLRPLALFWNANQDYSYGWGVPLLAAFLFYERWRGRPAPVPLPERYGMSFVIAVAIWGAAVFALRLVLETEPASRPLLWLAATLWCGAVLAWTGLLGGGRWVRHFAFPVLFLLTGVPWIFRIEFLLVQDLMRCNAAAVAEALRLAGFSAQATGNTITLPTGQLGVTEACSGIRSLQAALMLALFFGEFYRFGGRGRAGLLGAGVALALAGNFARMLYLAWRGATQGVAAVEAVHDSTGWVILLATVAGLWLVCLAACPRLRPVVFAARPVAPAPSRRALGWAGAVFATTLLAESATQAWYSFRESAAPHYPSWTVAWPNDASHFQSSPLPDTVRRQLHADAASEAAWQDGVGWRWSGLWIRYRASAEGKVVFESHNPGLCLGAAGWNPLPARDSFGLEVGDVHLDVQAQSFAAGSGTVHVFWIPYLDGGGRAGADRGHGLYGHTFAALAGGRLPWLEDVWQGCRRVDAETLEIAVTGPARLDEAATAFRKLAPQLIQPDAENAPEALAGAGDR